MTASEHRVPDEFRAYSPAEVAKLLGVSERHLRREAAAQKLATVKSGNRTLIMHSDLVDYIERGRKKTAS